MRREEPTRLHVSKMRCDTAHALFNSALGPQGPRRGPLRVARLSSGRLAPAGPFFMPTCTCALGFSQHERDLFGGWSAQGSGRYSRIARLRVLNLERAIVKVIHENTVGDQLNGSEMLHEFHDESVLCVSGGLRKALCGC